MKLYNKNGFLSRALRFAGEFLLAADVYLVLGHLLMLPVLAIWQKPIPEPLRPSYWIVLGGNAAVLLTVAVYVLWRESRKIRLGVISPETIRAVMEETK